jgi:hypothetical protein
MPQPLAQVQTVRTEEWACPLGSSVNDHPGQARVQQIDAASAAAATSVPGSPTGDPGKRPRFASGPSGYGQRFGVSPKPSGGAACMVPPGNSR